MDARENLFASSMARDNGRVRTYPDDGRWLPLAMSGPGTPHLELFRGDPYMHLCWTVQPQRPQCRAVGPPSDGWPVYHSGLYDLPIEELLDRILRSRAERPRSTLTFDRRKRPW